MASESNSVASTHVNERGEKRDSAKKLVWWIFIFSFFAGMATLALSRDLRTPSNLQWLPDIAVGLSCFIAVRLYALRLLDREKEKDSTSFASK